MKKPLIMFDKTEVIAYATIVGEMKKKSQKLLNITPDRITRISFVSCKERKLFKIVDSEKIVLTLRGYANPVEYTKKDHSHYYNDYKASFEKFAKDNGIVLLDETK